jgi:hypothetical protein
MHLGHVSFICGLQIQIFNLSKTYMQLQHITNHISQK